MGAIIKTIPIHSESVNPLLKYCGNKHKTSLSKNLQENENMNVSAALNYAANPLKTICNIDENHKEILTSGVKCDPATAAQEFEMARQKYREATGNMEMFEPFEYTSKRTGMKKIVKRQPVTAIHLIQSFDETNLDPHVVHQIGVELLEQLGLQGVVDTHLNKAHMHNHIIINTYLPDGTKWNCNNEERLRVRELSDEIQKEYGLEVSFEQPREQLMSSKGKKRSYGEWLATEEGASWKDQMKRDILEIASTAKTRDDYLSVMEAYGYKVENERDDFVTYVLEENGMKISENTLGKEYTIGELFPIDPSKKKEIEHHLIPLKKETISVAKYNADGSRRGFLEMLIRKAIAILQQIIGLISPDYRVYTTYKPVERIAQLETALSVIKDQKIENVEVLQEKLETVGAELSHLKAEVKKLDSEKDLYDTLAQAVSQLELLRQLDTHLPPMELHRYTPEEIRKNRAKIAPPSPSQKSAVAVALQSAPQYRLSCKYSELMPSEVDAVLDFLHGKTTEKPAVIVSQKEADKQGAISLAEHIYESRRQKLEERFGETPADEKAIASLEKMLAKQGIERDLTGISQADVMDIRNCYSENPFASPIIDEKTQEAIRKILAVKGLELNRPVNYITKREATNLLGYLKEPDKYHEPSLLKPFESPREGDIENARRIMEHKKIQSTVPLTVMSKSDFDKFYTHIISAGQTPKAFVTSRWVTNQEQDNDFLQRIEDYKPERILYLTQYRDALNILRAYGYKVGVKSDLADVKADIDAWMQNYNKTVEAKQAASDLYHDLITTKNTVDKATDPEFLYGKKVEKEMELVVEEKEERVSREEEQQEQERQKERKEQKAERIRKLLNPRDGSR